MRVRQFVLVIPRRLCLNLDENFLTLPQKPKQREGGGDPQYDDADGFDEDECTEQDSASAYGLGLVNRRVKPLVADDCIDLALFVKDPKGVFPKHVLKQKNSGKKKPSEVDDTTDDLNASCSSDQREDSTRASAEYHRETQKQFERFVIRESYCAAEGNSGDEVPVSVIPLRDSSTTTCDLKSLVSTATQTDESCLSDRSIGESDTPNSSVPQSIEDMSRKRTVMARDGLSDANKGDDFAMSFELLNERCDKAERRMEAAEHEHVKEMAVMRSEHYLIRDDLRKLREKVIEQKSVKAIPRKIAAKTSNSSSYSGRQSVETPSTAPTVSWVAGQGTSMIMTQDSQGDPVLTSETPAHATLN